MRADKTYHVDEVNPVPRAEQQELFVCYLECGNTLIKLVLEPEATRDLAIMLRSYYKER